MAIYAGFLSGGSQIGPVIAGYLIQARGWRWFFILCAIIAAVNFVTTIFFLPETIYEPEQNSETTEDTEKALAGHIEAVPTTGSVSMDYNEYMKGLFSFKITKGAKEKGILKLFTYLFLLPFPLLLVPGILIASLMYGVVLGG